MIVLGFLNKDASPTLSPNFCWKKKAKSRVFKLCWGRIMIGVRNIKTMIFSKILKGYSRNQRLLIKWKLNVYSLSISSEGERKFITNKFWNLSVVET